MKKIILCLLFILVLCGCRKKAADVVFYPVDKTETTEETTLLTTEQTTTEETSQTEQTKQTEQTEQDGFAIITDKTQKTNAQKAVSENNAAGNNKPAQTEKTQKVKETAANKTQKSTDLYVQANPEVNEEYDEAAANIKTVENAINSKRSSSGAGALSTDSALSKAAQTHSDSFAAQKSIYSITGHETNVGGKVNRIEDMNSSGFNKILERNGFLSNDLSKIGIGISESDNGGYYYVIIGK